MSEYLDLRGTPCPANFVRCRLALEELNQNNTLQVDLDRGEPEETVLSGLRKEGYEIKIIHIDGNWIRFLVKINGIK
jgi:TusA-related sulfurtransferase|tara:strand:+ start:359 stop:589 length:231 start_codon:yes stop_codon:yes gene_type:complete